MEKTLKMKITIEVEDDIEQLAIGNHIHKQLRGNQDYIDNNIVLNIDADNTVKLYVFKECEEIPTIII